MQELGELERTHGIRLATIRDRLEERFVQPMVLDHLCALIEPDLVHAKQTLGKDEISPLERALAPFAATPSGVGLDVTSWVSRLQGELERVLAAKSDLASLAETMYQVPTVETPFAELVDQLRDWEKLSQEDI